MEPLSLVFTALATGATAALKPVAEQGVKDAYASLKALIQRKWNRVEIESLERDPTDADRRALVKKELERADGLVDREVLERAQTLLAAVRQHDPAAATEAGITLEDLEAGAEVDIEDVVAQGAIAIKRVKAGGTIQIKGVRAGNPRLR